MVKVFIMRIGGENLGNTGLRYICCGRKEL